jgi:hypothetical protein
LIISQPFSLSGAGGPTTVTCGKTAILGNIHDTRRSAAGCPAQKPMKKPAEGQALSGF